MRSAAATCLFFCLLIAAMTSLWDIGPAISSASPARTALATASPRVLRNIPYIHPHGHVRIGDLYLPAGHGPFPAVLLLHGGGWVAGSKGDAGVSFLAPRLAKRGWVVFNINYRLVRRGGEFPADLEDCKNALAWLIMHAEKYHINITRIVIAGASAGAHLALLTAYTRHSRDFPASRYPAVRLHAAAAIGFYTPTDAAFIRYLPRRSFGRRLVVQYLAAWRKLHPHTWLLAPSPVNWAAHGVPTLLLQGTADTLVPPVQAVIMQQALKRSHIPVTTLMIPGVGHAFMDFHCPARTQGWHAMEHFLARIHDRKKTPHPHPPQ